MFRLLSQLYLLAGRHLAMPAGTGRPNDRLSAADDQPGRYRFMAGNALPAPAIKEQKMMSAKHGRHSGLRHIAPAQLDYIIRQVQAEGYHVERISSFGIGAVETAVLVEMIRDWAHSVQLKVGFNDAHDICVFEQP